MLNQDIMRRSQNLKESPTCFNKTATFAQQHVAFSEKLDFKWLSKATIITIFFDLVKLFVHLRGMDIYAWDTFTLQLRLHNLQLLSGDWYQQILFHVLLFLWFEWGIALYAAYLVLSYEL